MPRRHKRRTEALLDQAGYKPGLISGNGSYEVISRQQSGLGISA